MVTSVNLQLLAIVCNIDHYSFRDTKKGHNNVWILRTIPFFLIPNMFFSLKEELSFFLNKNEANDPTQWFHF
jgi:hypothetical protein